MNLKLISIVSLSPDRYHPSFFKKKALCILLHILISGDICICNKVACQDFGGNPYEEVSCAVNLIKSCMRYAFATGMETTCVSYCTSCFVFRLKLVFAAEVCEYCASPNCRFTFFFFFFFFLFITRVQDILLRSRNALVSWALFRSVWGCQTLTYENNNTHTRTTAIGQELISLSSFFFFFLRCWVVGLRVWIHVDSSTDLCTMRW